MNEERLFEANIKLMDEIKMLKRDMTTIIRYIKGLSTDKEEFENIINYYNAQIMGHKSWSKYDKE